MTDITTIVRLLVILLLIALIVILVMRRLALPYTLGLVIVGLFISIFANALNVLPDLHLDPSLVLFAFLPALLFEGSWTIETAQLRKNWFHVFLLIGPALLLELLLIAVPHTMLCMRLRPPLKFSTY